MNEEEKTEDRGGAAGNKDLGFVYPEVIMDEEEDGMSKLIP